MAKSIKHRGEFVKEEASNRMVTRTLWFFLGLFIGMLIFYLLVNEAPIPKILKDNL